MALVKADRPLSSSPGADQQRPGGLAGQEIEQFGADSAASMAGFYIGVADERDIADLLNAHDAEESARLVPTPELDSSFDFGRKRGTRHIRLVPAVRRDRAAVCFGGIIDNGVHGFDIGLGAGPNHRDSLGRHPSSSSITSAFVNLLVRGA